ncbi:hypothetical protein LTR04_004946, partial [Oleoguttula sp. CCFEE 6159]
DEDEVGGAGAGGGCKEGERKREGEDRRAEQQGGGTERADIRDRNPAAHRRGTAAGRRCSASSSGARFLEGRRHGGERTHRRAI